MAYGELGERCGESLRAFASGDCGDDARGGARGRMIELQDIAHAAEVRAVDLIDRIARPDGRHGVRLEEPVEEDLRSGLPVALVAGGFAQQVLQFVEQQHRTAAGSEHTMGAAKRAQPLRPRWLLIIVVELADGEQLGRRRFCERSRKLRLSGPGRAVDQDVDALLAPGESAEQEPEQQVKGAGVLDEVGARERSVLALADEQLGKRRRIAQTAIEHPVESPAGVDVDCAAPFQLDLRKPQRDDRAAMDELQRRRRRGPGGDAGQLGDILGRAQQTPAKRGEAARTAQADDDPEQPPVELVETQQRSDRAQQVGEDEAIVARLSDRGQGPPVQARALACARPQPVAVLLRPFERLFRRRAGRRHALPERGQQSAGNLNLAHLPSRSHAQRRTRSRRAASPANLRVIRPGPSPAGRRSALGREPENGRVNPDLTHESQHSVSLSCRHVAGEGADKWDRYGCQPA